jgi:arginyl-tRNA synthetase
VFYAKPDGAVWVDNTAEGLDEKVVQRSDGTSLYMTQDIGTALQRFEEFPALQQLIYVVGNEQDRHFKVLFIISKKLGFTGLKGLHHLSYGMVDLPRWQDEEPRRHRGGCRRPDERGGGRGPQGRRGAQQA